MYYPGWKATIDGQPAKIARADYILRAMNIPAGKHQIEMTFNPESLQITESIAFFAVGLLVAAIIMFIIREFRNPRKESLNMKK